MSLPLCDPLHLVKKVRQRVYVNYPAKTSISVNGYQFGETDIQFYIPDTTKTFSTNGNFNVVLNDPSSLRGLNFKIRVMTALTTNIVVSCATPTITYNYPSNPAVATGVSSFTVPVSAVGDEILVSSQGDQWYVTLVSQKGGTLFVANTATSSLIVPVQCVTALDNIVVQKMTGNLRLNLASYALGRDSLCKILVQDVVGSCTLSVYGAQGYSNAFSFRCTLSSNGNTLFRTGTKISGCDITGVTAGSMLTIAFIQNKGYVSGSVIANNITLHD